MHIPDGFLDAKTAGTAAVISAVGTGLALRQVRRDLPPRKIPLLGLAAAFIFAAQMVNFPVVGGTSGHLVGGVLAAALLGPGAAVIVLTTVLIVQCLLFADGGVLALGANILNMGIVNSIVGGAIYQALRRLLPGEAGRLTAIAFAGWSATVIAAMVCAGELAWSGTIAWTVGSRAMASVHMLIGLGEGLISALVLLAVQRTRPDLLPDQSESTASPAATSLGQWCAYGFVAALGIALFLAPFACPWPDGLDHVAAQLGFDRQQTGHFAPAPDYRIPGVPWAVGATAAAGGVGTVIVFGLAWGLGRALTRKGSPRA